MKLLTLLLMGCLAAFFLLASVVPAWAGIAILSITAIVFGTWCGKVGNFLFGNPHTHYQHIAPTPRPINDSNRATLHEEESDESVDMEEEEYNENEWSSLHL